MNMARGKKIVLGTLTTVIVVVAVGTGFFFYSLFHRVEGKYFDSNGVQIHYTDEGSGEPVILVHGFAANADANWRSPGVTGLLAKHHRVIVLDNRGHGLSGKPHDPAKYGIEMVEDIPRLMDHLKIPKAHIVGYSMGAFMTLKLLTLHPERFVTATIGGAGHQPPKEEDRAFFDDLAKSLESGQGYRPLFVRLTPIGKPVNEGRIRSFNRMLSWVNDPLAIAAVARSFQQFVSDEDKIKSNTVPVLQVCGTTDPLRVGVENLSNLLPNEEVVWIEGGDHISTVRRSELAEAIDRFIDKHPMTAAAPAVAEATPVAAGPAAEAAPAR
jgi:pimeloyl-ACP methyl ester carboxylesterase